MTIDKAIELLTAYCKGSDVAEPVDFDDAVKLGLEALKFYRTIKAPPHISPRFPLPGETEEQ